MVKFKLSGISCPEKASIVFPAMESTTFSIEELSLTIYSANSLYRKVVRFPVIFWFFCLIPAVGSIVSKYNVFLSSDKQAKLWKITLPLCSTTAKFAFGSSIEYKQKFPPVAPRFKQQEVIPPKTNGIQFFSSYCVKNRIV